MGESNHTNIEVQSLGVKAVFDFLSSGKTDGVWLEFFDEMAVEVGLHCMQDLQNFIAICRPGSLAFWSDYISKVPCRLPEVAQIAESTHNVLLYIEQIEEALQLLTGCTPDESADFRRRNVGIKVDRISRDILLKRIAEHQGVSGSCVTNFL